MANHLVMRVEPQGATFDLSVRFARFDPVEQEIEFARIFDASSDQPTFYTVNMLPAELVLQITLGWDMARARGYLMENVLKSIDHFEVGVCAALLSKRGLGVHFNLPSPSKP